MKYLTPVLLGLSTNPYLLALVLVWWSPLAALCALLAVPVAVLVALPFARWDDVPSADSAGACATVRGQLPPWALWLGTPNERLPGGTYEPTVAAVLARFGRFWCAWYWLGVRNQLYGLSGVFSRPIDGPWTGALGYQEKGRLWWLRYPLPGGKFQFKAGYRTYFVNGAWVAVPCCTLTKA